MTDTPVITEPEIETVQTTILQRIAPPFFSFSFVLFAALLASQAFLLPRLVTFRVGESSVVLSEGIIAISAPSTISLRVSGDSRQESEESTQI